MGLELGLHLNRQKSVKWSALTLQQLVPLFVSYPRCPDIGPSQCHLAGFSYWRCRLCYVGHQWHDLLSHHHRWTTSASLHAGGPAPPQLICHSQATVHHPIITQLPLPQSPKIWWDPEIHCQWHHQHQSGRNCLDSGFTSGQFRRPCSSTTYLPFPSYRTPSDHHSASSPPVSKDMMRPWDPLSVTSPTSIWTKPSGLRLHFRSI